MRRRTASHAVLVAALAFVQPAPGLAVPGFGSPQHVLAPSHEVSHFKPSHHGYRGWSSWSLQAYRGKVSHFQDDVVMSNAFERVQGYGFTWLNETNVRAQADVVVEELQFLGCDTHLLLVYPVMTEWLNIGTIGSTLIRDGRCEASTLHTRRVADHHPGRHRRIRSTPAS